MTQENLYQAPASSMTHGPARAPRRWGAMVRSLVALQTLLATLYASTIWNQFHSGEISALVFLAFVSASVLSVVGAFLLSSSPRSSSYFFFSSALLGALVCTQWRPPFVVAGLLVAICAGLVGSVSAKRSAKG